MAKKTSDNTQANGTTLHTLFATVVNTLDEHLRIVQYSVYGLGVVGMVLALRSFRPFTKLKNIQEIPAEFIANHSRCRAKVRQISCKSSASGKRSGLELSLDSSSGLPPTYNIYLRVEHIPTFQFFQNKTEPTRNLIPLKLASVEVFEPRVDEVKLSLENSTVWFTILRHHHEDCALECIIRKTNGNRMTTNQKIVLEGLGMVAPFDACLSQSNYYKKVYKKLLQSQEKSQKRRTGMWAELLPKRAWPFAFWRTRKS